MTAAVLNGLLIGGFYALVALGLSVVFGVLRVINLAHGAIVISGAYLATLLSEELGLNAFAAIPLVFVIMLVLGYLLQRYLLTGLLLRRPEGALVATFGLSLALDGLFTIWAGSGPRSLQGPLVTSGISLFGIETRAIYLVDFGAALVLSLAAYLVLSRTRAGAVIRAAAADTSTAGLMGIDIRRVYAVTFAVSAAVAAVAGVLLGATFSFTPDTGTEYLLTGVAVVVLGGVGNVLGTFCGGLLLGLLQSVAAAQFGGGWRDFTVYALFFVALVIRPQGVFARPRAISTRKALR
jgi:branched-chain amino acid transport system permease protein